MSTDDVIEQRLADAGQRWRATHSTAVEVRPDMLDAPGRGPSPRRRGLLAGVSGALVAAAVVALVVVAHRPNHHGAPTIGPATAELVGRTWQLTSYTIVGGTPQPPAVPATLHIDDTAARTATLTATDGCAPLSGSVTISADQLRIPELAVAGIGCVNDSASFDRMRTLIDTLLSGAVSWSVDNGRLTLSRPGAGELVYTAAAPRRVTTDPSALTGTSWTLTGIVSPDGTSVSSPVRPASITFTGDGRLTGSDGCNAVSGPVTIRPGQLDVGQLGMTFELCPGTAANAESSAFDSILGKDVSWSITGSQLTLRKEGAGALVFAQAITVAPLAAPTASATS